MAQRDDVPPPTGYLLWHVSLRWRVAMDRLLAPLGLTHAQYAVVASLHAMTVGGARPSQRQLARYSGLEPMYISRLVRTLEQAGLVERTDNPDDPRAVQLALTPRGMEVVTAAVPKVRELEERYLEPLGGRNAPRTIELRRALQTLLAHADALGGTPAPAAFDATV
ncbi:MarR family transcriptional regulator [Actinomadura rubrobrunea]|uniref:MarR family transcriptional regulator n=1 Tax=Actinomadura rubrobrunea TaxID=115335 RepID=A0A9W6UWR9_9ACTN|nr:MarR family transcriptional regulator [Actinomadura rubrobrunea]GLW63965.1 MarR family transcriptional regulator [Actinomadura rubrobrunea]